MSCSELGHADDLPNASKQLHNSEILWNKKDCQQQFSSQEEHAPSYALHNHRILDSKDAPVIKETYHVCKVHVSPAVQQQLCNVLVATAACPIQGC